MCNKNEVIVATAICVMIYNLQSTFISNNFVRWVTVFSFLEGVEASKKNEFRLKDLGEVRKTGKTSIGNVNDSVSYLIICFIVYHKP